MRKFFAPEVVQTSNMDCGPAALKCLLEGFGIEISYGRLREACQTGIDGTSIDSLETVANQLGLQAEQVMIPVDHLLIPEARALPALVVVNLSNSLTHFVIVWRRQCGFLQVMDPSMGRRWVREAEFLAEVYRHSMTVPAEGWREFAGSVEFQAVLRQRLNRAGILFQDADELLAEASSDATEASLAALDAAVRLLNHLNNSAGLKRNEAKRLLPELRGNPDLIPAQYWSVRPAGSDDDGNSLVVFKGAVLIRALGKNGHTAADSKTHSLKEPSIRPDRFLWRNLRETGALNLAILAVTLISASAGVVIEALLFRSLFDVAAELHISGQRLAGMTAVLLFSALLLLLDIFLFTGFMRLGRLLENQFRIRFLTKIPLLQDRYFRSRLTSDLAERCHSIHRLRNLPDFFRQAFSAAFRMLAMAGGLIWLQPAVWPLMIAIVAVALLPPFLTQSVLAERDLRVRSHVGGLTRFYLDAMLGLLPIRAHSAASSIQREQDKLLGTWSTSALHLQRAVVAIEAFQLTLMFGLVACMLLVHPLQNGDIGRVLLVIYWALNLPALGQEISATARQYPSYRNQVLRMLDPFAAPEEVRSGTEAVAFGPPALEFKGVSAQALGQTILHAIDLEIRPGEHVAVVGPSGAGKSSLISLLLGWLDPCEGEVLVNGQPLNPAALRERTAWVDPSVQLWNSSLYSNLRYGSQPHPDEVGRAVDASMLRQLLESLPEGLQTKLGESGGLVSGGEGERVRLARAMLRADTSLVLLDEAFRGLDRAKRHELLLRSRKLWKDCTLLFVTHDISETEQFDRVIVVENGTVVEDGVPRQLRGQLGSRYAQLLAAEKAAATGLWSERIWRRVSVQDGTLVEKDSRTDVEQVA